MAKAESILAVDIGADSIKIAEFIYPPSGGGMILDKFAFSEYGGELKDEELIGSLRQTFRKAVAENGFKSRKVHISISGQSAFIRFAKLSMIGEDQNKLKKTVEMEAKQNVPFPINEVVWDYQLISKQGEDSSEIEVVFVVVKNDIIESLTKVFEDEGKEVGLIEVAPTACFNSARANGLGQDNCVMILNMGSRCSSLVFIDNGKFFVRSIPIAGYTITQQISKEFSIPFADAEEMKRRHGFVALGGAYEEPDSEVAATVSKIVRNVMTRLHGEINRSINVYRSQQKGNKPEFLYLTGGSAVMAFTPRFFSEKLRMPVDYFNPFQVVTLGERVDKEKLLEVAHMYSEVIGLGLRQVAECPIEISLIPDVLKKQQEFKQKIPYFYAGAASVVLCLGIAVLGVSRQQQISQNKVAVAETEIKKTTALVNDVKAAMKDLKQAEKDYLDASEILKERKRWPDLLNSLQNALPDMTWLVSVKGASQTSVENKPEADMGGGGLFPIFGGAPSARTSAPVVPSEITLIQVEGHSLLGKNLSASFEEEFKERLVKMPMFTDKLEEVKTLNFVPPRGDNNLTSFKMEIKLKEPLKK